MSLLCVNSDLIAVAFNTEIKWRNSTSSSFHTLKIPFEVNGIDTKNISNKSNITNNEFSIKDIHFSEDGKYFVVLTSLKEFYLYDTENFSILYKHELPRAASKLTFSFDSQFILVADKTGDALIYKTEDYSDKGKKIFGHLSLLTDILMSRDNKFIVSCDRDEKIKVSNYPGSYDIESFCLGHKEFITSINFLPHNERALISASGDGSVKLWDYPAGREILNINVHNENSNNMSTVFENFKEVMKIEDVNIECLPINYATCCKIDNNSSLLAVSLHLSKSIIIYRISGDINELKYKRVYTINLEGNPTSFVVSKERLFVTLGESKLLFQEWKLSDDAEPEKGSCEIFEKTKNEIYCIGKDENITLLYKRKFDNLQDYQKRKKQRIENHSK